MISVNWKPNVCLCACVRARIYTHIYHVETILKLGIGTWLTLLIYWGEKCVIGTITVRLCRQTRIQYGVWVTAIWDGSEESSLWLCWEQFRIHYRTSLLCCLIRWRTIFICIILKPQFLPRRKGASPSLTPNGDCLQGTHPSFPLGIIQTWDYNVSAKLSSEYSSLQECLGT